MDFREFSALYVVMGPCRHSPAVDPFCLQVFDYYAGGADTESTVRDNRAVYGRYRLLPRYMVDVSHCDLSYTLLGKSPEQLATLVDYWPALCTQ